MVDVVSFVDVCIGGQVTVQVIRRAQHECLFADCLASQYIKLIEMTVDLHTVGVHPDSTVVMCSSHSTAVASLTTMMKAWVSGSLTTRTKCSSMKDLLSSHAVSRGQFGGHALLRISVPGIVGGVLDEVNIFVVVDVENLTQFQDVRIVRSVAGEEGVLVVQSKGGETTSHDEWVKPFHSKHNWEAFQHCHLEGFPRKLNHSHSGGVALNFVRRVSGSARAPLNARRQTVFWEIEPVRGPAQQHPEPAQVSCRKKSVRRTSCEKGHPA